MFCAVRIRHTNTHYQLRLAKGDHTFRFQHEIPKTYQNKAFDRCFTGTKRKKKIKNENFSFSSGWCGSNCGPEVWRRGTHLSCHCGAVRPRECGADRPQLPNSEHPSTSYWSWCGCTHFCPRAVSKNFLKLDYIRLSYLFIGSFQVIYFESHVRIFIKFNFNFFFNKILISY